MFLFLTCQSVSAESASTESVITLLEITKAEAMLEQVYATVELNAKQDLAKRTEGQTLSEEEKELIARIPSKIAEVFRAEFSWSEIRAVYIDIYQEAFTQAEINDLIQFYKSSAGQSYLSKMPLVLHRSMQVTTKQLEAIIPKIRKAVDELLRDAKLRPKA
jgi:hypothetical protein